MVFSGAKQPGSALARRVGMETQRSANGSVAEFITFTVPCRRRAPKFSTIPRREPLSEDHMSLANRAFIRENFEARCDECHREWWRTGGAQLSREDAAVPGPLLHVKIDGQRSFIGTDSALARLRGAKVASRIRAARVAGVECSAWCALVRQRCHVCLWPTQLLNSHPAVAARKPAAGRMRFRRRLASGDSFEQFFNPRPEYWRRLSLSRFPLIHDGFAGCSDLCGQACLRQSEFASDPQ